MADIICFENYLGAGKTLGGIRYSWEVQKNDPRYVLYANVHITENYPYPHKEIDYEELLVKALSGEDFDDPNIVWFFDEIGNYFDARTPGDTKNRIFSWFVSQVRKRHSHLIYTGKDAMLTDIRLRDNTKYLFEASKRERDSPRVECDNAECLGLNNHGHVFRYEIWKILRTTKRFIRNYWIGDPEIFFQMYDSYHIPAPADIMSKEQLARIAPRVTNLGLSNENAPSVIQLG